MIYYLFMKELTTYITEKLDINKIKITNFESSKYILIPHE